MSGSAAVERAPARARVGTWGLRQRLIGVVIRPADTFAVLGEYPEWRAPLGVMAAVVSVYAAALVWHAPVALPAELAAAGTPLRIGMAFASWVFAVLVTMASWLAWLVTMYVCVWAAGSRVDSNRLMTVLGYSAVPNMIKTVALTLAVLIARTTPASPDLSALLHLHGPAGVILKSVEPFTIWSFVLCAAGLEVVMGLTRKRAVLATLAPLVLGWTLQIALQGLTGA